MTPGRIARLVFRGGSQDSEARLRFQFYTVFVALGLPNFLVFGGLAFARQDYQLGVFIVVSAVALVAGWLRLGAGHEDRWVYRVNAAVFGLLALNMLVVGGEGGSKSLWLYTFPLIVTFLFSVREGAAWGAGMLLAVYALLGFSWPWIDVYPYPLAFKVRLMVMYVVIIVLTLGFEYSRRVYRDAMLAEQGKLEIEHRLLRLEIAERERAEREKAALILELQDTLTQVKTLKGLVPICASCHRIRDDRGFWNQLETYLHEHSDAQFSHGICPGCMADLYPDYSGA